MKKPTLTNVLNLKSIVYLLSFVIVILGLIGIKRLVFAQSHAETNAQQTSSTQPNAIQIPIEIKQLPLVNSIVPVELQCDSAYITQPGRLERFSCNLKNNTSKNIIAGNVLYSVIFEFAGQEVTDTRLHTFDTFIHPDFYETNKSIQPRGQRIIEPPGPIFYAGSIIKRIEITIEFIEFEDQTMLGDSEKGSEIITNVREGAAMYKAWLVQQYIEKGRSAEPAVLLLQESAFPSELGIKNQYQEQGARAYRTRLRRIYETDGFAQVYRHLNK